jgi:hypothetical protein
MTMKELIGEEDPRRGQGEIYQLSVIQRSDQRIERTETKPSMRRTHWYSRIPPTMHGLEVIARQSCHQSWNRSELWRAIPGAGN